MKKNCFLFIIIVFIYIDALAQNTGIGTQNPQARFHVADSSVLFTGPASLPSSPGLPPVSGAGTRMMWYPNKAAFRVGQVSASTYWSESSIGKHSFAAGLNTRAAGEYSVAFGNTANASGDGAFAWGSGTLASGTFATASGFKTSAPAYASTVIGRYNLVSGNNDTWVDTDPLFVVGNGYETVENNIATIVRQNALTLNKKGDMHVAGRGYFMGGLFTTGIVEIDKPTLIDPILYNDVYVNGRMRYKVNVITMPATQADPYILNTNAYSGSVFDLRLLRNVSASSYINMNLTDGQYIGEKIMLIGRDWLVEGNLPAPPPGMKWGGYKISTDINVSNVRIPDFTPPDWVVGGSDSVLELMWMGNYWVATSRNNFQ